MHENCSLAPADYHRFHSPIDAVVGDINDIPGEYYTVNPQAVNESGFDVFTANKRSVLYMTHKRTGTQVAFVAIGAMLVSARPLGGHDGLCHKKEVLKCFTGWEHQMDRWR